MPDFSYCKLEIFVPASHFSAVQTALAESDAGHIGAYDQCLSYSPVTSFWRPLAGTHPYLGAENTLCQAEEFKVEVTCRTEQVDEIIQAVKAAHPYEEPVINVIPLYRTSFREWCPAEPDGFYDWFRWARCCLSTQPIPCAT